MQAQSAPPTITDYYIQLDKLRQQEDELFKQALINPSESHLAEFESIWNQRNTIYQAIENTMTPLPEQATEAQESIHCTVEEVQAIPEFDWYQMELWGKKEWQPESQTYLCKKGVKLPESIIQQYELTLRQVAILQQEITLEGLKEVGNENEDEPCWYDVIHTTSDKDYSYTAKDIIAGRY